MIFFVYIIFICSKLWDHPKRVFYLFKHQIIIFTPFSEKYAIEKVLSNLISFKGIDTTTCICSSFFFYWNDFSFFFSFQWKKKKKKKRDWEVKRQPLAIDTGSMEISIWRDLPGARKQYFLLIDLKKQLKNDHFFSSSLFWLFFSL